MSLFHSWVCHTALRFIAWLPVLFWKVSPVTFQFTCPSLMCYLAILLGCHFPNQEWPFICKCCKILNNVSSHSYFVFHHWEWFWFWDRFSMVFCRASFLKERFWFGQFFTGLFTQSGICILLFYSIFIFSLCSEVNFFCLKLAFAVNQSLHLSPVQAWRGFRLTNKYFLNTLHLCP